MQMEAEDPERAAARQREYEEWVEQLRQESQLAASLDAAEADAWAIAWREAIVPVQSRVIASVAWLDGELRVLQTNGKAVCYSHVPRRWYDALIGAPSKGRFLVALKFAKDDHPCRVLEPEERTVMGWL